MVPPCLFANRVFTTINLVTLLVYAGLSAALLFLVLFLQTVAGWRRSRPEPRRCR